MSPLVPTEQSPVGHRDDIRLNMATQCFCAVCIDSADRGVIQNCGKFSGIAHPGCSLVLWPIATVTKVSMMTKQIDVQTNTKTKDNVTVSVTTAIMYHVGAESTDIEAFFFRLHNPHQQITAYVDDCIRSQVPTMTLDEAFEAKEKLAVEVKAQVAESMKEFGVQIVKALLTDMQPDHSVMAAMNRSALGLLCAVRSRWNAFAACTHACRQGGIEERERERERDFGDVAASIS